MKIRLLDYKRDEYFIDIPDGTDEIIIDISGDMPKCEFTSVIYGDDSYEEDYLYEEDEY